MLLLLALQAAVASAPAHAQDRAYPSALQSKGPDGSSVHSLESGRSLLTAAASSPPAVAGGGEADGSVHTSSNFRRGASKLQSWASPKWQASPTTDAVRSVLSEQRLQETQLAATDSSVTSPTDSELQTGSLKRQALRTESWASPNWSSKQAASVQSGDSDLASKMGSSSLASTDLKFDSGDKFGRYALRPRWSQNDRPQQQAGDASDMLASVSGAGSGHRPHGLAASEPAAQQTDSALSADKQNRPAPRLDLAFDGQKKFAKYSLRIDKNAIVRRRYEVDGGSESADATSLSDKEGKKALAQKLPPVTASLRNIDPRVLTIHYRGNDDFGKYAFAVSREVAGRRGKGVRDLEAPALAIGSSISSKGSNDRGLQAPVVAAGKSGIAAATAPLATASAAAGSAVQSGSDLNAAAAAPSARERLEQHGIRYDLSTRVQSFVAHTNLTAEQPFNFENNFARLPSTEINAELRPRLTASYGPLDIMVKPRARFQWDRRDFGPNASLSTTSEKSDVFLLEGRARLTLWDKLFVSYGREALLWGPAMYITPSNPFFVTNNRANPYREIRGREYAKATYVFNNQWTASFFSNLGLGLDALVDQPRFERTDAVKLDFTGISTNASLILSRRDNGLKRIGGYVQWTTSDALLLYVDGNISFGTDALYPRQGSRGEWYFQGRDNRDTEGLALFGASYTASFGPTLSVEYVHNTAGYGDNDAANYYRAVSSLRDEVLNGGAARAAPLLNQAQAPGLSLLRKNYLFLQLLETNLADQLDVTIRYTHNLDDGSSDLVPIFDWSVGSATHLFALAQINMGAPNKESRRYVDNQVFTGINFTFD